MDTFFILIISAVLSEAIWEILKNIIPTVDDSIWKYINLLGAVAVGIFVAIISGANIFALLDITAKYELAGSILTGILISRGSNYIHDLVNKLKPKA